MDDPNNFDPQSPIEVKPDTALILQSPNVAFSHPHHVQSPPPQQQQPRPSSPSGVNYPPLSGSKHFCTICGDRASGKHYGVYSCEGCKGFFKRTVRKELTYACRENKDCVIDKRQRNRCQYCRYMKCLTTGMRREAVQEERHRTNGGRDSRDGKNNNEDNNSVDNSGQMGSGSGNPDMAIERILEAENIAEGGDQPTSNLADNMRQQHPGFADKRKMLTQLVEWAKHIPHFSDLKIDDQVILLRSGWNELLIAGFAFRSMQLEEGILWADGQVITRENAHLAGVGEIFDRVLVELVGKMKEMKMDKAELGCLRAIVLFNPDAKGLDTDPSLLVETHREKVYATLEEYCRLNHENEPSRFAKLLLRLPALRSIGLKCVEHLFFYKLIKDENGGNAEPNSPGNSNPATNGTSSDAANSLDVFIKEILED